MCTNRWYEEDLKQMPKKQVRQNKKGKTSKLKKKIENKHKLLKRTYDQTTKTKKNKMPKDF